MKPGLTKGDLERIEKDGPSAGPDPFGELFREKQTGPAATTPASAPAARAPLPEQDKVFAGGGFGSYGSGQRRAPLPTQGDIFAGRGGGGNRMGTPSNSSRRGSPPRGGDSEPNRWHPEFSGLNVARPPAASCAATLPGSCGGAASDNRLAAAAAVVAGILGAGDGALAQALGGLLRPQGVPPAGTGAPTGPMSVPPPLQSLVRQSMPGMHHGSPGATAVPPMLNEAGGQVHPPPDPGAAQHMQPAALQQPNMALTHCPRPQVAAFRRSLIQAPQF